MWILSLLLLAVTVRRETATCSSLETVPYCNSTLRNTSLRAEYDNINYGHLIITDIQNTSWKVRAYGIYALARVADVSVIERVSGAKK